MKFLNWLKPVTASDFQCNIYLQYETVSPIDGGLKTNYDLVYAGSLWDVPYWLAEYEIAPNDKDGESISFCHNMFKNIDDEHSTKGYNGLCIYLQQQK